MVVNRRFKASIRRVVQLLGFALLFCGRDLMLGQGDASHQQKRVTRKVDCTANRSPEAKNSPAAPKPEPITVNELPLPPVAPSGDPGACSSTLNSHHTGCMTASDGGIAEGPSYMWDGVHVLVTVQFVGAPPEPGPAAIYAGPQVIAIKTDGSVFPNGDPWKCITCGVPEANRKGAALEFDHPQPFHDGKRVLAGTSILDCSPFQITDSGCGAQQLHIYPIHWPVHAGDSGKGGYMRELRLNPDDTHLGWSHPVFERGLDQFGFFGRLKFNADPSAGEPLVPRYDLTNVTVLFNAAPKFQMFAVDPDHHNRLLYNKPAGVIGEFRGWTSDGQSALGIGTAESGNFDGFATDLQTGASRRLTRDPAYTDPMRSSPDDKWIVVMDSRVDDRQMWVAGMRGVPPLVDMLTAAQVAGSRNNGNRRFFEPFLIDRYGDRGAYHGQQVNAGDGEPGSASDPSWNGRADPTWSPDGTRIVFWQALVTAPACGGANPLQCPVSTEPGGRRTRLMIARLTGRTPVKALHVEPLPDVVPWGLPYHSGDAFPVRPQVPPGDYTLAGSAGGSAEVRIERKPGYTANSKITVLYDHYSDDGVHVTSGSESAEALSPNGTPIRWHSALTQIGCGTAAKNTSEPDGFIIGGATFDELGQQRSGGMITTIGGKEYVSPLTGR